ETGFMNDGGEWVIGCPVPLKPPWRGLAKLANLAAPAIQECLRFAGSVRPEAIPMLLGIAEKERPGRLAGLDEALLPEIQKLLGLRFHPRSGVVARGRVAGAVATDLARRLIHEERF